MKTVIDIKAELLIVQNEIKERLELFIKNNPDISVSMNFSTETSWYELMSGEKHRVTKEIKSELNITID